MLGLAAAHPWRPRITPPPPDQSFRAKARLRAREKASAGTYSPWAELLKRTLAVDALECPNCHGRMQPIAVLRERESIVA